MLKKGRAKLSRRAVQVKLKWWLYRRKKKKKKKRRRIERRFILLRRFSPSFLRPYNLRDEEEDDVDNNETASLPFPSLLFVFNFSAF